jgi:ComF family protein
MIFNINNWLKNNQWLNFNGLAQFFFKQNCLLCAGATNNAIGICKNCLIELPHSPATSCPQCGLSSNGLICGSCLNSAPNFDVTHAVFIYAFPVDSMMQRYKYGNMLYLGQVFGQLLSQKTNCDAIDLIIPMPMHPARLKERGFNQALEIAKKLNKEKLDYTSVIRHKLTPPQASLPFKDRVKNIKGAFQVASKNLHKFEGKRIAIVDDVMTTGASLNELAKALKNVGASHVECWIVARTLPPT